MCTHLLGYTGCAHYAAAWGELLFVLIGRSRTAYPPSRAEGVRRGWPASACVVCEVRIIVTGNVLLSTGTSTASTGTGTPRAASGGTRFADAMRRVGGPYSVTWFAFWVTLAQNMIHHLSSSPEIDGHWGLRLLAVLASQLAMFGVLLLARATVLRHTATRPRPIATLAAFAVAGAARGTVLVLILAAVVPLPPVTIIVRPIIGACTYTVTLAFCSFLVSAFQENKRTLARAEESQAALVQARDVASRDLADQREEALDQIRDELLSHFDELSSSSPQMSPEQLDDFIDQGVRPASHRLASGIERWQPVVSRPVEVKLSFRRAFTSIGLFPPFSPLLQTSFSVAFTFAIAILVPAPRGPLALLGILVSAWALPWLGNKALSRLSADIPLAGRVAAVTVMTVFVTAAVAASWWVVTLGTDYAEAGLVYGLFLTPLLAIMSIAGKAALTAQRDLEDELEQSQEHLRWDIVRVRQLQWLQQQRVARALHGPVQGTIIAEAMRLETGPDELRSTSRLRSILTQVLDDAVVDDDGDDLDTTLESLVASWSYLCEVTVNVDAAARGIDGDHVALLLLRDLLGEAVGNAVRHGEAHNVWVSICPAAGNVLRVEVLDDGQQRNATQRRGLGSQMLDDCCLEWGRDCEPDGTRLVFLLPFVPALR